MGEDLKNNNLIKCLIALLTKAVKIDKPLELSKSACSDWIMNLTVYHNFIKTDTDGYHVIDQFIDILKTPIAKRNGVTISIEDAKVWIIEFKHLLYKLEIGGF